MGKPETCRTQRGQLQGVACSSKHNSEQSECRSPHLLVHVHDQIRPHPGHTHYQVRSHLWVHMLPSVRHLHSTHSTHSMDTLGKVLQLRTQLTSICNNKKSINSATHAGLILRGDACRAHVFDELCNTKPTQASPCTSHVMKKCDGMCKRSDQKW